MIIHRIILLKGFGKDNTLPCQINLHGDIMILIYLQVCNSRMHMYMCYNVHFELTWAYWFCVNASNEILGIQIYDRNFRTRCSNHVFIWKFMLAEHIRFLILGLVFSSDVYTLIINLKVHARFYNDSTTFVDVCICPIVRFLSEMSKTRMNLKGQSLPYISQVWDVYF